MSRVQTSTSRRVDAAGERLLSGVRWTARRGRVMATLCVAVLSAAALIGGLFVLALKDMLFDLPAGVRLALLALLLVVALTAFVIYAVRPWLDARDFRAAGQRIDRTAKAKQQPVTLGLTLHEPMDDDSLALMLLRRAEVRGAEVAKTITPRQAYPFRQLGVPGAWLGLAVGLWLVVALIFPSQVFGVFARVAMPWSQTPPFSLTQMEPRWTPAPPTAGDDVELTVRPSGVMPDAVQWVRVDEAGDEVERFEMRAEGEGVFRAVLERVASPIVFRLEANGRYTQTYTIEPTPRAVARAASDDEPAGDTPESTDGATAYDPEKVARRDLEKHRDWPELRADVQRLIDELADVQSQTRSLDPADIDAMQALSQKLAELVAEADALAGELLAMQGDLPADASALLDAIAQSLANMQAASLPAPPSADPADATGGEGTASQWLDRVAQAAQADRQRIGQGIGPSDRPTESGTASGQPGDALDFRDPAASGTYDSVSASGDAGPLPDAKMQRVPPSYRAFVSRYFDRLAEREDESRR